MVIHNERIDYDDEFISTMTPKLDCCLYEGHYSKDYLQDQVRGTIQCSAIRYIAFAKKEFGK